MDNLLEIDRFLEKLNLQRLNQEEIEIMNRSITNTGIKTVIKISPQKQKPRARCFTGEFHQAFREELMPIFFLKLFQKLQRKDT